MGQEGAASDQGASMRAMAGRVSGNDRGMVLFATLAVLTLLIAVGVGALVSVQNEFRISANLTTGTAAFYLADSGIEWAKEQLSKATAHPPILENRAQSLPAGSFAVAFIGAPLSTRLRARVVVRSTGSAGQSSQTVQAQLSKSYDLADAAVALRGNSRGVNFGADAFVISGIDFDPAAGTPIVGARPRLGISLSSATLAAQVHSGLSDLQRANVTGGSPSRGAISLSDRLAGQSVARLADDVCGSPDAQLTVMSGSSVSLANQTWGTRAAPQIRCIKGLAESGDSVIASANFRGAGILVVQDAELVAVGPLNWAGLVLVTGENVGFRVEGTETKEIFGGLVVNETGLLSGSGPALFDVRGAVRILFSRPVFADIAGLIPAASLERSYASLPFTLTQDYWRTVNP